MATALASLLVPLSSWFWSATNTVQEPYLDEFFHVRQAQHYCDGRFGTWDPKITTPPGLYLLSYLLSPALGCDLTALRGLNGLCIDFVLLTVIALYAERAIPGSKHTWRVEHCGLNTALFPPLFFFSALYYTDVPSTLSVLLFYWCFLRFHRLRSPLWQRLPTLVILGLLSLLFRQTNIFWVSVFPAAITFVSAINRGHVVVRDSMERASDGFGDSFYNVAKTSYKMSVVYDPSVRDASFEDYIKTTISIAACALKALTDPAQILAILQLLSPFLAILTTFFLFVLWNGSVVLGDKSNHVATLHLPQMLYIWPFIVFFSWPLVLPYLLTLPLALLSHLPSVSHMEPLLIFRHRHISPRLWLFAAWSALAAVIVQCNTIVHPFTLADNRHYTFYIFRLLLRPGPWVKFAVIPVYIVCAWACVQALGAKPLPTSTPVAAAPTAGKEKKSIPPPSPSSSFPTPHSAHFVPNGSSAATLAFVLIWLATSALQLTTAPLVEPRYFILPWIFWRIHLPLQSFELEGESSSSAASGGVLAWTARLDVRLVMESVWSLVVHAATAWIFLRWGFEWSQEPGKVQRFMW